MVDVSVIVPVYKAEKYLRTSVISILNQTHKNIEIILVDDASPDDSGDMCDNFAEIDTRIKVIHKERNEGTGLARWSGMEIASGEYIYFCDPDDIILPTLVEDNLKLARQYNCGLVFFCMQKVFLDKNGGVTEEKTEKYMLTFEGRCSVEEFWRKYDVIQLSTFLLVTTLIKRSIVEKNNLTHSNLTTGQDMCFFYDVLAANDMDMFFNNTVYYSYLQHADSTMWTYKPQKADNECIVVNKIKDLMLKHDETEPFRDTIVVKKYITVLNRGIGNICRSNMKLLRKSRAIKKLSKREEFVAVLNFTSYSMSKDFVSRVRIVLLILHMYIFIALLGAKKLSS